MLKVGVFGTGHLGKFHLNNWKEIADVELVGFFDPDDDTAIAVSEKYQLPRFLDSAALMDAVDLVDVVAPTTFHFEICEQAIKKGKHVFVEKTIGSHDGRRETTGEACPGIGCKIPGGTC